MRIIIIKFPYVDIVFCEKLCELAERLGCEIAGVVSLDLEEKLSSIRNYPIYPLNEILNLQWE
ncbi:MAG: hypothetical protein IJP68_06575, partial [Selenomonadaceae bacterium]|nr:hypothetical protein [Selenomonadaceae bacterium]